MCTPQLWLKRIASTNRLRHLPATSSTGCRSIPNGCRRSISMTSRVRSCSNRSRCCRNITRRAPNLRSCVTGPARYRLTSLTAQRWWNSAQARPRRSGCCSTNARFAPTCPWIFPVTADFTAPFGLPDAVKAMPKVGFFPGSTLGNFEPHEACAFMRSARDILGEGAQMIIGVDLEKNERVLYNAYNDAAGITARFNLNVLVRINRELGGNFDTAAFMHRAIYNRDRHRIEMHLISKKAQTVRILGRSFSFR